MAFPAEKETNKVLANYRAMKFIKRISRKLGITQLIISRRYNISNKSLNWVIARCQYPDELRELVRIGRRTFGWYSSQLSRSFENPWVLHHVLESKGHTVLDIGAGVSPLPLALAAKGWHVTTVDDHPQVFTRWRRPPSDWGYVDYSTYSQNIKAVHGNASSLESPPGSFDCIYSVSVLEHVPSPIRRIIWERCRDLLREGGTLLLTFDLIPGGIQLWNRSEEQQVEDPELHGDVETLKSELEGFGFSVVECSFIRDLPGARVDTAFLRLEKPNRTN